MTEATPTHYRCRDCDIQSPIAYQGDELTPELRASLKAFRWRVYPSFNGVMAISCHRCFMKRVPRAKLKV